MPAKKFKNETSSESSDDDRHIRKRTTNNNEPKVLEKYATTNELYVMICTYMSMQQGQGYNSNFHNLLIQFRNVIPDCLMPDMTQKLREKFDDCQRAVQASLRGKRTFTDNQNNFSFFVMNSMMKILCVIWYTHHMSWGGKWGQLRTNRSVQIK